MDAWGLLRDGWADRERPKLPPSRRVGYETGRPGGDGEGLPLTAATMRSIARVQENHSSANRREPSLKRSLRAGSSSRASIAAAIRSGSLGGHSSTFSPSRKGASNFGPRVATIGSPWAAAAAKELLFNCA